MTWRSYHESTKHSVESLTRTQHVLDWANMPDPFRNYEGVPVLDLPADPPAPEIAALDVLSGAFGTTPALDGSTFLSELLFYSASISASKRAPSGAKYALRVNPSSGNLHPTEFRFLTRGLPQWPDALYHYRASSHMAEQLAVVTRGTQLMENPADAVFLLSSIESREAWKYGARAYRYCWLDAGHAWQSLALAARSMGREGIAMGEFADDAMAELFQLSEDEQPMLIIQLRKSDGEASKGASGRRYGETARGRRSALDFEGGARTISISHLSEILDAATRPLQADFGSFIQLYLYAHRIEGLAPGVYRHRAGRAELELRRLGDQRVVAAGLSLRQDLAGNACVAFSLVGDLERATELHGDRGYRYVHFEAGAIGQRLYLAAEALGFGATGIGAFFDDEVNGYLELPSSGERQVVYHFAIGYPIPDPRLEA